MTEEYNKAFDQEKQDVIKPLESMPYERALRYIDRKLKDLKAIRKTKTNNPLLHSMKLLKQKQKEINKKVKQQEKVKIDNLFDENKHLKQELEAVRKQNKERSNRLNVSRLRISPLVDGLCLQMEDEIAAVVAIVGASWGGTKAMTATSGPGFCLMQEGIGLAVAVEAPCVIVNVQRGGPASGQSTSTAQGDFYQARYGSNGDYSLIVLCPSTAQEMFDHTIKAFNLSERFRIPGDHPVR